MIQIDLSEITAALDKIQANQEQILARLAALEARTTAGDGAEFLTPGEAARRYATCTKTLVRLVEQGEIRRYEVGTHARYRVAEMEDYMARKNKKSRPG